MTAARPGVSGIVIWRAEMEKLDKVMRCLDRCYYDDCGNCDYCGHGCSEVLMRDARDLLKDMKIAVTAAEVLERYRPAFEELAKGEE